MAALVVVAAEVRMASRLRDERDAVLGMACEYRIGEIAPFVLSLRATGFTGALHLGVSPSLIVKRRAPDFMREFEVTAHEEPCAQAVSEHKTIHSVYIPLGVQWLGGLNQQRYGWYKQWILEDGTPRYDRVWLLDVRDVVFLWHPFREVISDDLALFAERDSPSEFHLRRIRRCLSAKDADMMQHDLMPSLCGGSIFGAAAGVVSLCDRMLEQVDAVALFLEAAHNTTPNSPVSTLEYSTCLQNDQYLLNHALWSDGITGEGEHATKRYGRVRVYMPSNTSLVYTQYGLIDRCEHCMLWSMHAPGLQPPGTQSQAVAKRPLGTPALVHKWDMCDDLHAKVCSTLRWGMPRSLVKEAQACWMNRTVRNKIERTTRSLLRPFATLRNQFGSLKLGLSGDRRKVDSRELQR